jgi:hypothetical protein
MLSVTGNGVSSNVLMDTVDDDFHVVRFPMRDNGRELSRYPKQQLAHDAILERGIRVLEVSGSFE